MLVRLLAELFAPQRDLDGAHRVGREGDERGGGEGREVEVRVKEHEPVWQTLLFIFKNLEFTILELCP